MGDAVDVTFDAFEKEIAFGEEIVEKDCLSILLSSCAC